MIRLLLLIFINNLPTYPYFVHELRINKYPYKKLDCKQKLCKNLTTSLGVKLDQKEV